MLNGMYELGKFWIHEENMEKIEIVLDANKLNNTKKVLFVDTIIDGNNINYLKITEEEFTTAYNSLIQTGRPTIFVYVRKRNRIFELFMNSRLRDIKKKVFNYHQEYYVEYSNHDELRYKFYSDIMTFVENKDKSK